YPRTPVTPMHSRSSRLPLPPLNQAGLLCLCQTARHHNEHVYQISYFPYPFRVSARRTLRPRLCISNILSCFPRKVKKNSAPLGRGRRFHISAYSTISSIFSNPFNV